MSALNWQKAFGFIQKGKPELALVVLNKLAQITPVHPQVYHGLGILQLQKSDFHAAYEYLQKVQSKLSEDATFANHLGLSLHRLNRLDEALSWLKKAVDADSNEASFWANYGYALESSQNWQAMFEAFNQALSLSPHTLEFALGKAVALRQQNQSLKALQQLMRFSQSQDDAFYKEWLLNIWLAYGEPKTLENLDKISSNNADFYAALGDYFDEQLKSDDLLTQFLIYLYQQALKLNPSHTYSQYMLALLEKTKRDALIQAPLDYVEGLYDTHAPQFETQLVNKLGYNAPNWFADTLVAYLTNQTAIKLLDLGCGTGLFVQALHQKGIKLEATGVDISANMLKQAQAKALYANCVKQDIHTFLTQAHDASYTLISALDVLIYQGEYQHFLTQTKRVLSAKGYLAVTLECSTQANQVYVVDKSGRFQHGLQSFIRQAELMGFNVLKLHQTDLRMEQGKPVEGAYLLFKA